MKKLIDILKETPELDTVDTIGTDKNTTHSYIDFYEKNLSKYQNKNVSLLEIGVNSGGSLYLWGKYFENGSVLGLDIVDKVKNQWKALVNTKYLIHDAYDPNVVNSLQNFDIIIDDGPHTLESQIQCIKYYLPKLNNDGIMIIEDIQNIKHVDILIYNTPIEYQQNIEIIDLRSNKNRYDDILYVIKK
jgi:hypothetical protein